MPSPRRKRFLLLAIILSILVVVYITTGAKSTENSPFYQKTVALMDSKKSQGTEMVNERKMQGGDGAQAAQQDQVDATDKLKERLKEAEVAAKKSADDKWKIAADKVDAGTEAIGVGAGKAAGKITKAAAKVQDVVKEAVGAGDSSNDRGRGGRRKYPAPVDQAASEDGIAHVGPQVDVPKPAVLDTQQDGAAVAAAAAQEEFARILKESPLVIFSKSYCPHSMKAKRILLSSFTITPTPFVVELDQHELGHELQDLLLQKTGRRTVPNVLVAGKSIGGGDDVQDLWVSGKMEETLKKVGGKLIKSVLENKEIDED